METELKPGQRFRFKVLSDPPSAEHEAVALKLLSDRAEGFGPDVEAYMAYWVQAEEVPGSEPAKQLVFARGVDENWYLDGQVTEITATP